MEKKITKEELVIANAKLQSEIEGWKNADERHRKEFAKAFAWYKMQQPYNYRNESEPQSPTWEQVFVNVGFLTAQRDFRNYEGNISEIECAIEDIKRNSKSPPTPLT